MRLRNRIIAGALSLVVACGPWAFAPQAQAADGTSVIATDILSSGVVMKTYIVNTTRSKKDVSTKAYVVEADLTNPYVKLDAIAGTGGQFGRQQTVLGMAKETGAVAAVNGDFFNTKAEGVPMGPQVTDGKLLSSTSDGMSGMYAFALTKDNQPIVDLFAFQGSITAKDGSTHPLAGINKTYWWDDNDIHSHSDGLFLYNNTWGNDDRSNNGVSVPTEVKVVKDVIKEIAIEAVIKEAPPEDGYILRASGVSAEYVKAHLKVGDKLKLDYQLIPQDANKTYDTANFKTMIGGHTILVDEGQPSAFSRGVSELDGGRSRTAIGYSKDLNKVYLITAEKTSTSDGMTMKELQNFMVSVGVWKGLNLDGGGSTQLATRPLGETTQVLTNVTEGNWQRPVVNGFGIYSTAPKGELKGLMLSGPSDVFLGESVTFSMKGYDEYYNPMQIDASMTPEWSMSAAIGTFDNGAFKANKIGSAKLTATIGNGSATKDIRVLGRDDIATLKIVPTSNVLRENETVSFKVTATDRNGRSKTIDPNVLKWSVTGLANGIAVTDGELKVGSLKDVKAARVIGSYDGFESMVTLPIGQEKMWYDLDNKAVLTTTDVYPQGVNGSVAIEKEANGNKTLGLTYDFTGGGNSNKAVYATFNGKDGVVIEGSPQTMKIKVFGDNSRNWVRAEVIDGEGDLNRINFTENMNWTGWKELSVNLADYHLVYPITLKNVYVASPAEGQDERVAEGKVQFDDISFFYRGDTKPTSNVKEIKMTLNKRTVLLDSKQLTLQQAPVSVGDRTLVPIRFIIEALGGEVKWDPNESKATVFIGDKMLVLWNGKDEMVFNGRRVATDVGPRNLNGLTMVPLRVIAEELNWKVGWDAKTQTVTLK